MATPASACRQAFCDLLSPENKKMPSTFNTKQQGCRFIPAPAHSSMDFDVTNFMLAKENEVTADPSPSKEEFKKQLVGNLLRDNNVIQNPQHRILAFKNKPPVSEAFDKDTRLLYSENHSAALKRSKTFRHIPQSAEWTLDTPGLLDDYYLNLLDWSSTNVVAVALGNAVYLWHASTGSIEELMQQGEEDGPVTSVSWAPDGKHIAIGLHNSEVQLWDTLALRQVRSMKGHSDRVGSLSWNGGPMVCSGGRDGVIINHDVRKRDHIISRMASHEQEVCGLKWAPSGQQLASGGNDNMLYVWDARTMVGSGVTPYLHRLDEHQATVKALAWCPFQSNLLASGGGTADRCIKFWNITTGSCLNSIDTNSQVCALQWSHHEKEILSSHGFSQNQLCLWKYPSMAKMAELTGHTSRVLHLAQSPDGYTVASAAGDETLRFWQAFGASNNKAVIRGSSNLKEASGTLSRHMR